MPWTDQTRHEAGHQRNDTLSFPHAGERYHVIFFVTLAYEGDIFTSEKKLRQPFPQAKPGGRNVELDPPVLPVCEQLLYNREVGVWIIQVTQNWFQLV